MPLPALSAHTHSKDNLAQDSNTLQLSYTLMSSYYTSSKSVVVHDARHQYQRQPSADSSYSRSSNSSSAYHCSTMPSSYGTSPSGSSTAGGQKYRSFGSSMFTRSTPYRGGPLSINHPPTEEGIKTVINKEKVTIVNHGGRSYDKNDPHPGYRTEHQR